MEQQPTTGKIALKYGAILGAIGVVFGLMLYMQDMHYQINMSTYILSLALPFLFVLVAAILGIREFKKKNGGLISFGQGLKIGVGLALVYGIIALAFSVVLSQVIDPEMVSKQAASLETFMTEMGAPYESIKEQREKMENPNYFEQLGGGLLFFIFIGFIASLIPSLVMKKKADTE